MHLSSKTARRTRFKRTRIALAACACVHAGVWAQADPAPALVPSPSLRADIDDSTRRLLPTFIEGDRITGRTELDTVLEGDAMLRRGDTVIRADRLDYNQSSDLARAQGNVRINRAGDIFEGPLLELKVDAFEGFFNQPRYRFLRNDAYGEAERVDFIDDKRAIIRNATYTTCQRKPGPSWMPDWFIRASSISIDNEEQTGQASGAVMRFMGVPLLPIPSWSFPLSDKRKSGLLPPTIGIDNVNGIEFTQPYYWDIAPNRDATFFPALMSKRGIDLGGEFRYLERDYRGTTRASFMPDDRLRERDRWSYNLVHDALLPAPLGVGSKTGLSLNLNRVSDDNYWRDFSRATTSLTQRLLPSNGALSWSEENFSANLRVLKWQTLQDLTEPIVPPYDRLPQLVGRYRRNGLPAGFDTFVETDYTRFRSDRVLNNQPNARRSFVMAQLSRPWLAPGGFFTPKLQLHSTEYEFEDSTLGTNRRARRDVPTLSLDSGLVFERDASFLGRSFRQTIEPRAFYVYTPFRDQSALPNYDSALYDFNFATIYNENAFSGHDRISDNNLLTLGVSSRLLQADNGAEALRVGIAQRLRFKDQQVTLPGGEPANERLSDVLVGGSVNWVPQWSLDSTVQYNPKTRRSVRSTIGGRYSPGNYRVVSAAYRLQRGLSEQLDIGWQWPINDLWGDKGVDMGAGRGEGEGRWYSVGRVNMSLKDRRVVDTIAGFEYDAGCWLGRIVFERLQSGTNTSSKRVLFQLEFIGFTRLGSNALGSLKENIPRYQYLREQVTAPSRFSNYD